MRTLDRVVCDYPLPDSRDQDREFVTGDFGGFGSDRFVITREFLASVPRKLELVDGHIPGEQKLMMFLLTTMGLARVAALVGREGWLAAVEDEG
jgi:hypothetical protein